MTASREELLHSICPDMHLDKNFFLRIYGYDITTPGFAENALIRLEIMGCSKARGYYSGIKTENEYEHQKQMKEAAEWYMKRLESNEIRKGGGNRWRESMETLLKRKRELLMMRSQGLIRN